MSNCRPSTSIASSTSTPLSFSSDPRIEYDTLAQRWYVSLLVLDTTTSPPPRTAPGNLAVSPSSNPSRPFHVYQFETFGDFPDQPSLGFNDDKVVTGGNSFSCTCRPKTLGSQCDDGDYEGNEFLVWNKSELLAGDESIDTDYYLPGLEAPGQDDSDFPIIPAKSRSSTSTLWMASACVNTFSDPNCPGGLNIWAITGVPGVDSRQHTYSHDDDDSLRQSSARRDAEIRSSANPIDTADGRLIDAVYRDGILWASGGAACTPPRDTKSRSCLQFFEVLTGCHPTVNQDFAFGTKTFFDYYPSVDMDSADDLITAFTQSGSTEFPSAYVDGRLAGDPVNTLGTPVLVKAGAATYSSTNPESDNSNAYPWGDYSGAGIDPFRSDFDLGRCRIHYQTA